MKVVGWWETRIFSCVFPAAPWCLSCRRGRRHLGLTPPQMIDTIENSNEELLSALAMLAMDELTPEQLCRVEERFQLLAEGPLPVAAWVASRVVASSPAERVA
jgi:hypothetical protein